MSSEPPPSRTNDRRPPPPRAHELEEATASPRTSFCLLEAPADDPDSAPATPLTTAGLLPPPPLSSSAGLISRPPSQAQARALHHTAQSRGSVTSTTPPLTPTALTPTRGSLPRNPHALRRPTTITAMATTAVPGTVTPHPQHISGSSLLAPAMLEAELRASSSEGSMRELFPVDTGVFANPDNITPSLQTSIILGESQIVGQNGALASLHPGGGKRRHGPMNGPGRRHLLSGTFGEDPSLPVAAASALSISSATTTTGALPHPQQLHHHPHTNTGDTAPSSFGDDSPSMDAGMFTISDDFSTRSFTLPSWSPSWFCWPCGRPGSEGRRKYSMSAWEFMQSVCIRVYVNWDSYFLFFTLALATISIPIAVLVGSILKSSRKISYHCRCQIRTRQGTSYEVTLASLSSVLIPVANHCVLLFVSLWIGIMCSRRRKRVMKSAPTSMNPNLTSAFMLPCYEVIWYAIAILNVASLALYFVSFYPIAEESSTRSDEKMLESVANAKYPCDVIWVPFIWVLLLLPLLMAQHSVSHEAVRRAVGYSGCFCILILVLLLTLYKEGPILMNAIFIGVHVVLLSFYFWAKFIFHARSSFDFFFVTAVVNSIASIAIDTVTIASGEEYHYVSVVRSVVNSMDPVITVAILLSLRADTRYWLGIDDGTTKTRNPIKQYMRQLAERGMITNFSTRTSVYDVHRMIEEHRKSVVDFTVLKLDCVIAQGATSIVMRGALRGNRPIALKIYTSVQVTDEEVQRFSRETALNVQLSHPNIVKFYGLCVVPPSISLVFEFCEYGGLDGVLTNGGMTSLSTKLRAWLDACRAVAYLHSFSPPLLHRDIKTDNFLVGQDFTLKLADFGEANLLKPRSDGTMTIAGTVDYMAPEMILGGKTARYGTGVDVYSLMITLWQIMVPERSPWEGRSHLEVYNCVTNGERPPLLPSIPTGCAEILEAGWGANPSERVAVEDIIPKVHKLWLLSSHQKTLKRTK